MNFVLIVFDFIYLLGTFMNPWGIFKLIFVGIAILRAGKIESIRASRKLNSKKSLPGLKSRLRFS